MTEYLTRLGMRGRTTGDAQPMQPSLRSDSPIAEHDQRIGMAGFAGFGPGAGSMAEADLEFEGDQDEILLPPAQPDVKRAARTTTMAGFAGFEPGADSLAEAALEIRGDQGEILRSPVQPDVKQAARTTAEEIQPRSMEPVVAITHTPAHAKTWNLDSAAPGQATAQSGSRSPSGPHASSPNVPVEVIRQGWLGPEDSAASLTPGRAIPGIVHTRHVRNAQEVDSPRLEPSPASLAEHFQPPARASEPTQAGYGGPSVVIGRINVEVVPPPVAPPGKAAAQPGPRTAASVSVIGPLSGGVRQSVRLSLRHR